MTCTNQADVFAYPWTCYDKLTFDQSFVSKHQIFVFENCCFGKKKVEGRGSVGTSRKFGDGEQKP